MKFSLAVAAILAAVASAASPFAPAQSKNNAESSYVATLMRGAKVTADSQLRMLENDNGEEEEYEVDISGYSVKFEKCQFVKAYDDDLADDEDSETVLATKRFVIFRLCPNNSCSSCSSNYGEYIISLDDYLTATVTYQAEAQEGMCEACDNCGNNADDQNANRNLNGDEVYYNVDCDTCYDECLKISNMETNGYVDATNFLECQMIYDPEDDGKSALYAGPICASSGTKIKIGVFQDEDCYVQDTSKDVDDYLMDEDGYQMKLSHALLKTVYAEDSCVSCTVVYQQNEDENEDENNDNADEQENQAAVVTDMCYSLYSYAAKCEKTHSFDGGYASYDGYANQLAQEEVVCEYITSLQAGTFDESGEIVVSGANTVSGGGAKTTGGQKFALTFFTFGTVGLAVFAAMLHTKLTKGGAGSERVGLAGHGGAMA
jgi:hypothetical protein